jgi:cytochrome c oxidase subunit 2
MRYEGLARRVGGVAAALVLVLASCGGTGDESGGDPVTVAGRAAAERLGCAACHGDRGQGVDGLGPTWIGLFGSTVALEDGRRVAADREYLMRAIADPDEERVAGFTLPMPPYRLSDEDMNTLLDYIEASQ